MTSNAGITALLDEIAQLGEAWKNGEQGAREGLLDSVSELHSTLLLSAENIIWTQWAQPTHTAVLRFGSEIGLFEALAADNGSRKSTKSIAEATNPQTEHTLVARMLRLLSSMVTVEETAEDTFGPAPLAKAMTQESFKEAVQFMQDDFNIIHTTKVDFFKQNGYKAPTSAVDTLYQFATNTKGQHIFEYWGGTLPLVGKRFASMMQVWSQDRPKWVEDGYYPVKERLIDGATGGRNKTFLVDVGGGSGHDILEFLQKFKEQIPGKLILQDRPEVIQIAEKELGPEITKMAHDFLTLQPVKGARAYYLHSIIQDWDDATCKQILRSIVPAMKKGYSKIFVNDYILPNRGAHWLQTSLDWQLMAGLGSRHRTVEELRGLVESVGLKIVEIFKHPQSVDSLIELDLA